MASSTQKPHHHISTHYAATAAPPPTPSAQPNTSNAAIPDALSHILHRLPPTLSLSFPTRRSSPLSTTTTTTTPPLINLADPTPSPGSALLSAATKLGFFNLTTPHHPIDAAVSTAVSLFNLPHETKQTLFPNNDWPLGYDTFDQNDDVDEVSSGGESFCFELSSSSTELTNELGLDLGSLREFGREMEKLGLLVMEELGSAVGFENPGKDGLCCMMWISDGLNKPGRVYPYAVGLHFQMKSQKYSLLSDSGWVNVSGQPDSVLVTLGDIAQVWSNGKLKKVRGIPMASRDGDVKNSSNNCITISLLITIPLESIVSPLIPGLAMDEHEEYQDSDSTKEKRERSLFRSFSFEDYAWRVYNERLLLKDPLVRYRV